MKKWIILFSAGMFTLMASVDMTIVNLAVAAMSKYFSASIRQSQLMVGSYLAAAALFFCLFGILADFFGKKTIFLLGSFLFVTASYYIGAYAHTANAVIIARFVQGMGFAATLGLAIVLIVQAFPQHQKGFATGMAVTLTGVGLALGPPLGGFILQNFSWQWIFLINVPLGIISILLTYLVVPADKKIPSKEFKLDLVSLPFYFAGVSILIYLLNSLAILSFANQIFLALLSLICIVYFAKRSLQIKNPLINITLLHNSNYLLIVCIRMLFMFVMASFLFLLPLYLQNVLNYSKLDTGLCLLSMTAAIAGVSAVTGKLIDKIGYKILILMSITFLLISSVCFINLQTTFTLLFLMLGLISFGISNGMHTPSTINGALSQIPSTHSGTAIGLFFTIAMIGSIAGVAVTGFIVDTISNNANNLQQISVNHFNVALHLMMWINCSLALLAILFCISLFRQPLIINQPLEGH